MSGAIPPLPNTPSWHGAQLKKSGDSMHMDDQAVLYVCNLNVEI